MTTSWPGSILLITYISHPRDDNRRINERACQIWPYISDDPSGTKEHIVFFLEKIIAGDLRIESARRKISDT